MSVCMEQESCSGTAHAVCGVVTRLSALVCERIPLLVIHTSLLNHTDVCVKSDVLKPGQASHLPGLHEKTEKEKPGTHLLDSAHGSGQSSLSLFSAMKRFVQHDMRGRS